MFNKYLRIVIVFSALCCMCYLNAELKSSALSMQNQGEIVSDQTLPKVPRKVSEEYVINAELQPEQKLLKASQMLIWSNNTKETTNEIYLHLSPNAIKNNYTVFALGRGISINEKNRAWIKISHLSQNGRTCDYQYVSQGGSDRYDSSVIKVTLFSPIKPGEKVKLEFQFTLKIPEAAFFFGYASGRNFFQMVRWYPKAGVFKDGEWICNPLHPLVSRYSDFSNYTVNIQVPASYKVVSSGPLVGKKYHNSSTVVFTYRMDMTSDFVFIASDDIHFSTQKYKTKTGRTIRINAFIQPENKKYLARYFDAVKNTLSYFSSHVDEYPYNSVTICDQPLTGEIPAASYPGLITLKPMLFSPTNTHQPEGMVVSGIVQQFFRFILGNNSETDAWLSEGISRYISDEILKKYYGKRYLSFNLFGYYPIFGINFLSYNEIPLIYTLGDYEYPAEALLLEDYYRSPTIASILEKSDSLPDQSSIMAIASAKSALTLHTLKKYLGTKKMTNVIKDYYSQNMFSHVTSDDFFSSVKKISGENLDWFFENMYKKSGKFDYRINNLRQIGSNKYEVLVERLEDGVFNVEIALYTNKDTLIQKWDGNKRWTKVYFYTRNDVLGAEVDPARKNLLDINFSNNSYMVNKQYGGSLSVSLRWFFWIQNLFLILGSAA